MQTIEPSRSGPSADTLLVSGGGDGSIKFWRLAEQSSTGIVLIHKFKALGFNVLSLAYSGLFLYAGLSEGTVQVYSLASRQLVRTLKIPHGDVNTLSILAGVALCGTATGWIRVRAQITRWNCADRLQKFDQRFAELETWHCHEGKILASTVVTGKTSDTYVTAGNDKTIAFWDVSECTRDGVRPTTRGDG